MRASAPSRRLERRPGDADDDQSLLERTADRLGLPPAVVRSVAVALAVAALASIVVGAVGGGAGGALAPLALWGGFAALSALGERPADLPSQQAHAFCGWGPRRRRQLAASALSAALATVLLLASPSPPALSVAPVMGWLVAVAFFAQHDGLEHTLKHGVPIVVCVASLVAALAVLLIAMWADESSVDIRDTEVYMPLLALLGVGGCCGLCGGCFHVLGRSWGWGGGAPLPPSGSGGGAAGRGAVPGQVAV